MVPRHLQPILGSNNFCGASLNFLQLDATTNSIVFILALGLLMYNMVQLQNGMKSFQQMYILVHLSPILKCVFFFFFRQWHHETNSLNMATTVPFA